jgi:hypothetical protein
MPGNKFGQDGSLTFPFPGTRMPGVLPARLNVIMLRHKGKFTQIKEDKMGEVTANGEMNVSNERGKLSTYSHRWEDDIKWVFQK